MKRIFAFFCLLVFLPAVSLADLPDLSGLSLDELLELRSLVDVTIKSAEGYQEIELPPGLWAVGVDFPAGTWLVTPLDDQYLNLWYGDVLNESGTDAGAGWDGYNGYNHSFSTKKKKDGSWKDPDYPHFVTLTMKAGWYFKNGGTVILTPAVPK